MRNPTFSRRQLLGILGTTSLGLAACQVLPKNESAADENTSSRFQALKFGESKTGFAISPQTELHTLDGHPENARRAQVIVEEIAKAQNVSGLGPLHKIANRAATFDELARVHKPEYIQSVQSLVTPASYFSKSRWSPYGGPNAYEAAAHSAGLAITLVTAIDQKQIRNGFALCRPPGHHATADQAMGYCIFNNIAVAVQSLQSSRRRRIAVVDFDVHHGNGIQDIFYRDADVLYISTHQNEWPHTGAIEKIGEGPGKGLNINVPLPFRTGDRGLLKVYEQVVRPALDRFKPEMIVAAAGFDSHWRDYQGSFILSLQGIQQIAELLNDAAVAFCEGRIAYVLEGGYQQEVLAAGAANLVRYLAGSNAALNDPFGSSDLAEADVSSIVSKVRRLHRL